MNLLAHLHLSDGTPDSMVGNVIADFVRNPDVATFPPAVQAGVRLHRLVDGFTDRHPVVQRSIARLGGSLGWYAGIVIDIYYDFVLARGWERYSAEPLRDFGARAYAALEAFYPHLPAGATAFVRRFIDSDLLGQYATADGIAVTLERVSRRIEERMPAKRVRLQDAMPQLLALDADLSADFHAFYPELVAFAAARKSDPAP